MSQPLRNHWRRRGNHLPLTTVGGWEANFEKWKEYLATQLAPSHWPTSFQISSSTFPLPHLTFKNCPVLDSVVLHLKSLVCRNSLDLYCKTWIEVSSLLFCNMPGAIFLWHHEIWYCILLKEAKVGSRKFPATNFKHQRI